MQVLRAPLFCWPAGRRAPTRSYRGNPEKEAQTLQAPWLVDVFSLMAKLEEDILFIELCGGVVTQDDGGKISD